MTTRSVLLLTALLALTLGASARHAECTPNEKGCEKCSKDGMRCTQCFETYGLTTEGTCVECKVPGPLGWTCVKCKGHRPNFCLKCYDWEGEQPTGVYATRPGRCEYCKDSNCHKCKAKTGMCQQCNRGYGLQGKAKACVKCKDDNCITCNGNAARCTQCYSRYAPNPKTGRCQKCAGKECEECKPGRPKVCTECNLGYKLVRGKCVRDRNPDVPFK